MRGAGAGAGWPVEVEPPVAMARMAAPIARRLMTPTSSKGMIGDGCARPSLAANGPSGVQAHRSPHGPGTAVMQESLHPRGPASPTPRPRSDRARRRPAWPAGLHRPLIRKMVRDEHDHAAEVDPEPVLPLLGRFGHAVLQLGELGWWAAR